MVTKPTQPSKPLFNIKETRLRHQPLLQSSHKRGNHTERPKTRGFFEPSICDAAGSGVYADDRLAGVQFLGLHRVVDHLEREGLRIEAVPVPSLSPPAPVAVTLAAFLAARERATLAEIMQNVIDVPPEKELLVMLKNAGWESRRTATGRFWVKTRG
ncbi:hypothetical protein AZ09_14195 [Acetobacter aceti 1023]|nr:hypothetical protein AZ09_14195 [Acetobacter aceti 1023]